MDNKYAGGIIGAIVCVAALMLLASSELSLGGAFKALLTAAAIIAVLLIVLVAVIMYFAFKKSPNDKNAKPKLSQEGAEVLKNGRESLSQLRSMAMRIKNTVIRTKSMQVCRSAEKILGILKEKPDKIASARQFLNYYLPTLGTILTKYERIERGQVHIDEATEKVSSYLDDINGAMEKQYKRLFDDELLDMTVEMEAMTMACRRDGLIGDEELELPDGAKVVNLRL